MERRIIDLSEEAASLSVRYNQLVIKRADKETTVPLEEVGVMVVSHPAVHYTHAVLNGLCALGGTFILCDEKRLPAAMLLPLNAHYTQTERLAVQIQTPLPVKKRLWAQIVKAKIAAQARLLKKIRGSDCGLFTISRKILSGDTANNEARASRIYWPALLGPDFRRIPGDEESPNCLLNYGYALVRAVVARSICAVGLHPSLGLHHHNRYDAFCLADDLMEPFRMLVDEAVYDIIEKRGPKPPLDKESKALLIGGSVARRLTLDKESRPFFDIATRMASSLVSVLAGNRKKLLIPEV